MAKTRARTQALKREVLLPGEGEPPKTRYVVGIDLGTTNTALAYVDRRAGKKARVVQHFEVEQSIEPGLTETRSALPSAAYIRGGHELSADQVQLPWGERPPIVVGELARRRGTLTPDRLVTSAKSWLCHAAVDRTADILPWGAPEEVKKLSPVAVEALLLDHLRKAWDHHVAGDDDKKRLADQDIVVTIPASFDEVARELTVAACRQAGFEPLLIEEPQAALYAWISTHDDDWRDLLDIGHRILVCDVGGGTTDFSLIDVIEEEGEPGFERTAVGDHLLLGGDNMDLALARAVESRLGKSLDLRAWHGLVQGSREAKVRLLSGQQESVQLAISKRGSKLIGGTIRAKIGAEEAIETILEGFFPIVDLDGAKATRGRAAGLKEMGLPFESDPAITRHLRDFLRRHAGEDEDGVAIIDHVLFNGGVFKTKALRERVLDALAEWQDRPNELTGSDLDLAVSRGAAYYGLVRRGKGTRIKSGAGRAYYLEVGTKAGQERAALCLIPRGLEEGKVITISEHLLELKTNRPVVFPFHTSTVRDDAPGTIVPLDSDFEELVPLHTVIRVGKKRASKVRQIPVELVARYTEIGTLEMYAQAKDDDEDRRWRLELDTRPARAAAPSAAAAADVSATPPAPSGATEGAAEAFIDPLRVEKAKRLLRTALELPASEAQVPLERVGKELEAVLDSAREGWPVPVIRALFDELLEVRETRKRSAFHEARWLNLAGFCLRPGFGSTLDPFRLQEMWKIQLEGMANGKRDVVKQEWVVMWRRVAGGLNRGQQETIFSPVNGTLLGKGKGASRQLMAEYWRMAASFEHLGPKKKRRLGEELLSELESGKAPPRWAPWCLARLGGRVPLYGPLDRLVSARVAGEWLGRLLKLAETKGGRSIDIVFPCVQLGRLTSDRSRNVADDVREQAKAYLRKRNVEARTIRPLEEQVTTEVRTEQEFYGDSVPIGLTLAE